MIGLICPWTGRRPVPGKAPNIGDRFIEDAIVWHLRETGGLSDEEFHTFPARHPLSRAELRLANRCRALILCGTNAFHRTFWPGYIKLTSRLSRIRVPILSFGCGWGGERPEKDYRFRPQACEALGRIAADFPLLSVRDLPTARLLEAQVPQARGRVTVTGCPVLFHANRGRFDVDGLTGDTDLSPRRIIFSPNERLLLEEHFALFERVRAIFAEAEITVVLNQRSDQFTSRLSDPRLAVFHSDDAQEHRRLFQSHDFQIGFRLHTHMSFLALSKPTLTVQTDGRTSGFAETFGLANIAADEIPELTVDRIRALLGGNAERLTKTGPERWAAMEQFLGAVAALPEPAPARLWSRLLRR